MTAPGSSSRAWWIAACRAAGRTALEPLGFTQPTATDIRTRRAFAHGFRDELGNRRPADRAFLSALLGVEPAPDEADPTPEAWLWRALTPGAPAIDPFERLAPGDGPLLPGEHGGAIEVWTESELAALHALDRLSERTGVGAWRARVASAAAWHVAEIQPDNATNRPWAIQVFVRLGLGLEGDSAALLHAQTMLHNCRVALGHADVLSACILEDAARALEGETGLP